MTVAEISKMAAPKRRAPLDPGFVPAFLWNRAFDRLARQTAGRRQAALAVEQPGGAAFVRSIPLLPAEDRYFEANFFRVERELKFLLWSRGGRSVRLAGAPELAADLAACYSPGGARAFDAEFVGSKIYLGRIEIAACDNAEIPERTPPATAPAGGLAGCRIGFDLGGSDRKCAALIDGEVVFSEEVPWEPYFQSDPEYHRAGIIDSLKRAAAHLPRVDAIGGSAAGVYVDNEPRVASLFRGVPDGVFEREVRPIFKQIAREWGVPVVVANDGDVTALAAARMLADSGRPPGGVLGLALGTSLAAGYVPPDGRLMPWLNELAFVPVDFRRASEGGHVDEWSGDAGTGARYHSQQALLQLLNGAEHGIDPACPLPEKLVAVQEAMAGGADWAREIYQSYGVYLGYAIAHFSDYYDFGNILILGRVASGRGGELMVETAREVLGKETPELLRRLDFLVPDEKFRRHGQAIAAASLPDLGGS